MRKYAPWIALFVALGFAGKADASTGVRQDRAHVRQVARTLRLSYDFALHYWGEPSCGEPTLTIEALDPGTAGEWWPDECHIILRDWTIMRPWFNPDLVCNIILHEWGHATGHPHTATGIMAPMMENQPNVCHGAAT